MTCRSHFARLVTSSSMPRTSHPPHRRWRGGRARGGTGGASPRACDMAPLSVLNTAPPHSAPCPTHRYAPVNCVTSPPRPRSPPATHRAAGRAQARSGERLGVRIFGPRPLSTRAPPTQPLYAPRAALSPLLPPPPPTLCDTIANCTWPLRSDGGGAHTRISAIRYGLSSQGTSQRRRPFWAAQSSTLPRSPRRRAQHTPRTPFSE
jgi:hypothetical protein